MVGTNLKAETMALMEKRSSMEAEMDAIIARLTQPGGPGISGNIVDSEKFPRADIDVLAIRTDRHRLAELRYDHAEITEKINQSIQVLHSARLAPKSSPFKDSDGQSASAAASSTNVHSGSPSAMDVDADADAIVSVPFAVVDEIADASPAAEDGLQLGDQIVKFGNVEIGDDLLQRLASEAQTNQGRAVPITLLRQGARVNLMLTPRTWQGRGLLGLHFRIL